MSGKEKFIRPEAGPGWQAMDACRFNEPARPVYDMKYSLVWALKYRWWIVREDIRRRIEPVFRQIVKEFDVELVELEVVTEHVDFLLN